MYYQIRLVLIILLIIFVPYKLSQWYGLNNKILPTIIFFLLILSSMFFMVFTSRHGGNAISFLHKLNMYWIGFLAFLITLTLLYFIIGWLLPIASKTAVISIFALSILLMVYSIYNASSYKNYEVEIAIEGLEEPLTIYHLPDVHLGEFAGKERSEKIVADINKIKPDLVIFNGDFIDSKVALKAENFAPFKETSVPLYFTVGNHDYYVGIDAIRPFFEESGIRILENEIIEVKNVQILGLDHINADEHTVDSHASTKKETVKSVLPALNINTDKPFVVAIHKPIGISYIEEAGADLILCGHTHAGQIFPATLIAGLQFEFLKGLYDYNNAKVYVTKGVGTFGPPMRLGAEAEATIVKLIPKS